MRFLNRLYAKFRTSNSGSIAIVIVFLLIPLIIVTAGSYEYCRALWLKSRADKFCDAIALAAVSKPELRRDAQSAKGDAETLAWDVWTQLTWVKDVKFSWELDVQDDKNGVRTAAIHYKLDINTDFAWLLHVNTLHLEGGSSATNVVTPNIDFHMLLDTSPSMAFPTTTQGMDIIANSNPDRHCQFACHSIAGQQGTKRDGTMGDLYSVAKSFGVPLRIDAEATAVTSLADFAQKTSKINDAVYRMSVSTFNISTNFKTLLETTDDLSKVQDSVMNLEPPLYYKDRCQTEACKATDPGNQNRATASSDAMEKMNAFMPSPGTGTEDQSAQEIMFVITDGMRDEDRPGKLPDFGFDDAQCEAIKNRGIRIGILYTVYSPKSCDGDDFSQKHILPRLNELEPALQKCASEGLFTRVTDDKDITDALEKLFSKAIKTAKIVK